MASTTVAHERALAPRATATHRHTDAHGPSPPPSPPPIVAGQKDGGRNTYVTRQKDGTRREGRGETWIKRVTGYLILSSSLATLANHFSSSFPLRVFAPRLFRLLRPATSSKLRSFRKWSLLFVAEKTQFGRSHTNTDVTVDATIL